MSIFKCPVCDGASWAPIIVDSPEDATEESLGSKEKFWLENKQLLFKFARDDPPGDVRGEDWAECVVHAVARALAIPSACVALGRCRNQRDVVVKTVLGPAETLKHGNEIMEEFLKDFDANLERANPQYTVDNVAAALHSYDASPTLPEWNALDQFMAYLVVLPWDVANGRDEMKTSGRMWVTTLASSHRRSSCPTLTHPLHPKDAAVLPS